MTLIHGLKTAHSNTYRFPARDSGKSYIDEFCKKIYNNFKCA